VIPTYNNVKNDRYLKNIRSVIMQNYTNFHTVIIDDASTDGTGGLILSFLRSQSVLPKERYEIIRN
jgi:glycosyltransferase involved in cell wall biosynthesis